jgi:thymidylate synthase (FAD)
MSKTYQTKNGTPYLKEPGVALIARPSVDLSTIDEFLDGFDLALRFSCPVNEDGTEDFIDVISDDMKTCLDREPMPEGNCDLPMASERLVKFAGQLCYLSLGPKRTMNEEMKKYIDHIKSSGHGSVFEHANYSFLFYGISRSMTHELVRHRAGFAYSQVSQRYVDGKVLRFVERPEYQADAALHAMFENRIDDFALQYRSVADHLMLLQKTGDVSLLTAEAKTDLRKKVNQCARSLLPNETEAPIVVTANVRAWRHFLEMRANQAAEIEIRRLAMATYRVLVAEAPVLFDDYEIVTLPDGTLALKTEFRKV